ncbi:uncharacterized protein BX664DRAFT_343345 [Halteromyces radiatus]|uniref:uncharacterized protein n=1 Tax=Halteromyces radiatus TaxID=101107 RepID=UPI00222021CD|nr:uncharacterized protein BX664DRAFT_343345 [Halteromyces radiatus]KAI8077725.1 hypothetical protein BX664DRAFT_343345 [Halteromyces radiatus]
MPFFLCTWASFSFFSLHIFFLFVIYSLNVVTFHMITSTLLRQACRHQVSLGKTSRFFSTSILKSQQQYHFDSYKLVHHLEEKGFSTEQSQAVMVALQKVISESMANLTDNTVNKAEFDKTMYARTVDFVQLRSEVQFMERNEYALMRAENERLQGELEMIRQKLMEEVNRTQANVRVDMHLEKGRWRDETSAQEIKIKETEARIESELAGLRTQMEAIKFQILQYFIGTLTGGGALFLAYLRMLR